MNLLPAVLGEENHSLNRSTVLLFGLTLTILLLILNCYSKITLSVESFVSRTVLTVVLPANKYC